MQNKHVEKAFVLFCIVVLCAGLSSCRPKAAKRYEATFLNLFDTETKIVSYTDDKDQFTAYANEIYDRLKVYHQLYDIYHDYHGINNLRTVNDNAGERPVKVDRKIIDLLLFAKKGYELTKGETNVAMGSVLRIWHKYREEGVDDPENARLPSKKELQDAAGHMNMDDVVIDEKNSTVFLRDPKMSLDVGAIAKGYAVEQVCRKMKDDGMTSCLVSVGGNVEAIGLKSSDNTPWKVAVENPDKSSKKEHLKVVLLEDAALVTSGNYQRYYMVDGKRYHHLIDKDTLYPSRYFAAVTIWCRDSGKADLLSTAVYNMPYREGKKLIESLPDTEAMWVYSDGALKYSTGFLSKTEAE